MLPRVPTWIGSHSWPPFDSFQLIDYLDAVDGGVADVGTGAGFPGMVLAIFGVENITLIEKNRKKAEFLKKISGMVGKKVSIINLRVEEMTNFRAGVLIARAFLPLPHLLQSCSFLSKDGGFFLLQKGKTFLRELTEAQKTWIMDVDTFQSKSDASGVILKIQNLRLREYD